MGEPKKDTILIPISLTVSLVDRNDQFEGSPRPAGPLRRCGGGALGPREVDEVQLRPEGRPRGVDWFGRHNGDERFEVMAGSKGGWFSFKK